MISASIVLFRNRVEELQKALNSVLKSPLITTLYLIDNSPTNILGILQSVDHRIVYIFNSNNIGFGAAHNIALRLSSTTQSKYHFVINPDIYFKDNVIEKMVEYMRLNSLVGMMMPKVLYPDNTIQYLPKLLPSPFNIFLRKIKLPKSIYERFIDKYELRSVPSDLIYNTPIISGCFTLVSIEAFNKVGGYDDSFFMYFEDWDLSRRMHHEYQTIYFPVVSIYHNYESGANRSWRLFVIFIRSFIIYFNKWGWFFDKSRVLVNSRALQQFSCKFENKKN